MRKIFYSQNFRRLIFVVLDVASVLISMYVALIARFEFQPSTVPVEYMSSVTKYMIVQVITMLIILWFMKLYHSVWTYISTHEVGLIFASSILGAAFMALGMNFLELKVPRSFYLFYFMLMFAATIITRFSYRVLRQMRQKTQRPRVDVKRTMVIGAGEAGNIIIRELQNSHHLNSKVVCVIDDSEYKKGKYIHGVKIIGGRDAIIDSAEKYAVDEIVVAMPSAKPKDNKEILKICNQTSCKLKVLPGMYQFINEEVNVSKLRDVSIEDLLGRDTIKVDLDSVLGYIRDKVVLVTGGGGSIGSELCRQIAKYNPKCLIIFDIYENNAYEIQQELKKQYPYLHLEVLIGSVRNTSRIESVMQLYRPNIVFHAAAHKHVPLMEDSPNEAIKNNVFGTFKTARAADKFGVERFVLISTDKAVNPTNVMGASKRMCEMIIQMFSRHSKTEYVAVRFGNVLGSNGSVIPLFKKQMAAGGPVTVTHPDIIRYFMTIPEAVSLVLQAGAYAKGGEIFVLDMGEPVKIAELAKNLIRLSGYTLGVDMNIEYTGLRPGEKLFEELLIEEEGLKKTDNELIFIGQPLEFDEEKFTKDLERLEEAITEERFDVKEIVSEIVPTYHIRKEDKERYSAIYDEFSRLGRISHEQRVMNND